jgi:hypothetical protein
VLGDDDPQAAVIRPTTATAATAVSGVPARRRSGRRAGDGEGVWVVIGVRFLPEDEPAARRGSLS